MLRIAVQLTLYSSVNGQATATPSAPYLTFQGRVIPNNSQVQQNDGSFNLLNDVQCHTDLSTCCNATYGTHRGVWLYPIADRYSTKSGEGVVSLELISEYSRGNYRCEIDTVASVASGGPREILYVGRFQGRPHRTISTLFLSTYDVQPRVFSLTCRVAFTPATFVQWMRDSVEIEGGVTTLVSKLEYRNVLNTTEEGVYTCHVKTVSIQVFPNLTRERNYTDQRTINVTTPYTPTNLTVSQNGIRSVLVSWTPAGRPSRYIIYYHEQGFSFRRRTYAGENDTSITLSDLNEGKNYSVSIVAETALQSSEVGPVNVTINHMQIFIRSSFSQFRGFYPGQPVRFTCVVTLIGTLTGTPSLSWQGPLTPLPTLTLASPSDNVFTSEFVIDSVNSSYEGEYTCTARLDSFLVPVENYRRIHINYQSRLSIESSAHIISRQPLLFTLTCTTTGGFPANVTWTKDSKVIDGGKTVISNNFYEHHHSLNATEEGVYVCTVSNDTPDSVNATLNATIPFPPSNVSVSQNGEESILISWIPSDGAEYYTIYDYQSIQQFIEGANDSITIQLSYYVPGRPFQFTIFANTALRSVEVLVNFTLGVVRVNVYNEWWLSPNVGSRYTLFCYARTYGNITGNPIFTWNGPGELPEPALSPGDSFTSMLTYNPLKLSNGGEVNCTVQFIDFPFQSTDDFNLQPIIPNYRIPTPIVVTSHATPFYAGSVLNMTCTVELNAAIDLPVVESTVWVIGGVASPVATERVTFSEKNIVFSPLSTSDSATYRCDFTLTYDNDNFHQRSQQLDLNVEVPPPPEVELTATPNVVAGSELTLVCSVTTVPHLIVSPHVELVGPGDTVLAATSTALNLSHTLDPVLASYAGHQYVCKAVLEIELLDISLQSQSNAYTLNVQIPRPNITTSADPQLDDILIDSSVTLSCVAVLEPEVDSFGAVVITWSGPRVISGGQYTVRDSGIGSVHTSNLTMPDIEKEDEGEYVCTVRVSGGRNLFGITTTETIPISVFVPMLTVSVFPISNTPLRIGTLRSLICRTIFDIEPPANLLQDLVLSFTWDGPRSSSGDYTISQTPLYFNDHLEHYYIEGYLTIHDIGYQDAGEYTCTVTVSSEGNDIGRPISESTTLAIPAPPPPEVELIAASTVVAGTELTLECSVAATPHLDVTLTNVELIAPGDTLLETTTTSLNLTHTVDPVLASNAGIYMCQAIVHIQGLDEPLISQSNHTVTIFIPSPNVTLASSLPDGVVVTSSITLTCNATLDPSNDAVESVVLGWSGPRLSSGDDEYSISQTSVGLLSYTSNLTIPDVVQSDEGEYTCTVSTQNDNMNVVSTPVTGFTYLTVTVPQPSLVLTVSPAGVINTSSSFTLTCDATLYSQLDELELTWSGPQVISGNNDKYSIVEFSSGLRYSSSLIVLDVGKEDEGEYVCALRGFEETDGSIAVHESIFISVTVSEKKNSGVIVHLSTLSVIITTTLAILSSL